MRAAQDPPDSVDIYVGQQVRAHREAAGLTQSHLGQAIGVTFQQVQKYERGANRISASMLSRIADRLDTTEAVFFPSRDPTQVSVPAVSDIRGFGELARLYAAMPAPRQRLIVKLAQELSDAED